MNKKNKSSAPFSFKEQQNSLLIDIIATRIYDLVVQTPLVDAPLLSNKLKNSVKIKREDMQSIFSFKIRGAYHKMKKISKKIMKNGVVAASAGNHAQGVALAAKKLNCKTIIVMPKQAQKIKIDAVTLLGAKVILKGENFDESYKEAARIAKEKKAVFIPPFDDIDIIAGNGTIAAEILRQHPAPLQAIFCPVGGGGLLAGIASYTKALRPDIKIIGVESEESACMKKSLNAGKRLTLSKVGAFADAVAIKQPGDIPFEITVNLVDDVIVVTNDELCASIKDLYEDTRVIFEPGGALALAGLKSYTKFKKLKNKNLVAIASGANMNFDRIKSIAQK